MKHQGLRATGWMALGVAIALVIGLLDYLTGAELSFALFYLAAIALAAWKVGRSSALVLAVVCAGIWFAADLMAGHVYSRPFIQYWNAAIRLGFFVVVAVLVAELRRSLDREQLAARVDTVTEAVNRRHLMERLEEELERARRHRRPVTLAYLDLDHFKQVNDHLGHAAGDRVLKVVASTLLDRLRKTDIVARFGGDEFALLLPETDADSAKSAIDDVRGGLLDRMGDYAWPVTFSIGVVISENGETDVETMIREADELMYRVKREGKNRVLYAAASAKNPPPDSCS